jgi:hypothetical protein
MRWIALLLALLAVPNARSAAQTSVPLRPAMPEIAQNLAPALWAGIPDADKLKSGMHLSPRVPFHWVFEPGTPVTIEAASGITDSSFVLTVWDWNRRPIWQKQYSSPLKQTFTFDVKGRGVYLLTLDSMKAGKAESRLARSFCVSPDNKGKQALWRNSAFKPGCCSFPGRQNWKNDYGAGNPPGLTEDESRSVDAELSARLGLVLVRPDLPVIHRKPEDPFDFTLADKSIKVWTDRGFDLALQVAYPAEADAMVLPEYAGVKDPKWRYPHTDDEIRRFAEETLKRYGPKSAFIEVFNEPDNLDFWKGTVPQFLKTHKIVWEAAHRLAPGKPVISGGLCLMDPERTGQIARGLAGMVDGVGYHSHGGVDTLEAAFTAERALHAAAGYTGPTFYNTEMGYANWRLDMEAMSAATAVQKLIYCWAHKNACALLYASREIGGPRGSGDWGMLDYTFCPRFSYGTVSAFCDWYAGSVFNVALAERNGLYIYEFHQGHKKVLSLYAAGEGSRPATIQTDATSALLVDAMGNAAPLDIVAGAIHVDVSAYPQTLILEGASKVLAVP